MKFDSTAFYKRPAANQALRTGLLLAVAALLSGCAGSHPRLTLDPVGPAPAPVAGTAATNGRLMVFSETVTAYDSDSLAGSASDNWTPSNYTWEYSDYKILSPDGKLFKRVRNNAGTTLLHPQQIELPAGKYCIVAESHGFGRVAVPVVVAANQVTILHLDKEGFWPEEYGFNPTNTVHLPDGRIVGWRAGAEAAAPQPAQKI